GRPRRPPRPDPARRQPRWLIRSRAIQLEVPMIETRAIETVPGMVFDVSISGSSDAPLVLMLHGFAVSRYFWNAQVKALAAAGFLAVAPNQRGYAAGARPDPADHPSYRIDRLIGDALDIV